ncbi:hypothetical protein SynBIOSU31_01214 [Synechococcus sp. BIOS-U3-1]|nr:hypothetical protein SynBIOSU31_01214 [Synechococcus sp. BIOS-U3-1]
MWRGFMPRAIDLLEALRPKAMQDDPAWYWPNRLSSSPSHL